LSKITALRGSACASWIVCVFAVISLAALVFAPALHHGRTSTNSESSLASQKVAVTPAVRGRIQASYAALPLAFEQNQGQTDAQVKYVARGRGYTLFLTANDAVFSLHSSSNAGDPSTVSRRAASDSYASDAKKRSGKHDTQQDSSALVRMQLVGANSHAEVAASNQLPGAANYLLGNDPGKWRRNVPRYERVSYQDVYPGVNMAFHGAQQQLEFDFLVAPRANPEPIVFHFTGAQGMKTDDSGNLVVSSSAGDVLVHKPVAYQEQSGTRQTVDARFVLKSNSQVAFELGNYDRSRELVIDPSVSYAYSTYLGGSGEDDGFGIAFDSSGNAYVTGETMSTDFPRVGGVPPNTSAGGSFDVFVTKIAANGSSLVYSTYVGGASGAGKGDDSGNAIAVDASGDAFVAGGTESTNFPTTAGSFQPAIVSGAIGNAFTFELNPAGSALTYSTYLGGSISDVALGVAVDSAGDVYAAGKTSSPDFPLSTNPLQKSAAGGFVSKLKPSGAGASDLVFSTYLGGGSQDFASAIALDSSGNTYVTGQTESSTFPTTTGAFQTTFGAGITDAFVTAIKADGSAYIYSSYLGGSGSDIGNGIAVDSSANAYIAGETSGSFPLKSPSQPTFGGGAFDAFVTKVNPSGSALVYSTYLGGDQTDVGASIAVDGGGNAYVTGQTNSSNFPTAGTPTQPAFGGGTSDAFVSEINSGGSALVFSTYLGGTGDEDTTGSFGSIAADSAGATIYVTGNTTSTAGFPIVPNPGAFQTTYGGGNADAYVVKYAQPAFTIAATTPAAVSPGSSAKSTVTLTAYNGYNSPVNLTCTVIGTGSPLPACSVASSFSVNPVTPTPSGAATTLTVTTTGSGASALRPRRIFYAMWLPIASLSLIGMGFTNSRSRRKKVWGFLLIALVTAGLLFLLACGGGGGGGTSCAAAPSAPTGLAASSTTSTGTTLNWTAAAVGANCGITGYSVYENGISIGTPSTTTFGVTGLTPSTTYSFTVAASDSIGLSAQSAALSVTTAAIGATSAGAYTVTITGTGTDAAKTTQTAQFTLTVN
jgi:Beta-propeller repeat/Fibronectin type III domain